MQKSNTDVFMSIKPAEVNAILRGSKTHVCRSYPLPATVRRIWLYTTAPIQLIEYIICISHEEVEANTDGKPSSYGYQVLQLWMLKHPIPLEEAISSGILSAAPRRYCWVAESFLQSRPYYRQYPLGGQKGIVR
ncbi:hypothetical protein N7475_009328 [Penicillium sp. IBT 31633x]|nr:hypothetical protein N7475_009328 [Penicillium sp. IBT 31633x]